MTKLEKKVLDTIKKNNLIETKDVIVIAVSGGPDSMALLSLCLNLKREGKIDYKDIVVAHVNHMLRKEAEKETKYVEEFCKKNNIKCYIKYINIKELAKKEKIGTEEAGRIERYKFFEEVLKKEKANKIAVAHNKKDNVETILMHLLRGSGVSGLSGIRLDRDGKYIRPILKVDRNEIEDYLKEIKVKAYIDKTNEDIDYTRNRIRNDLIPNLEKNYNENIINTIDRLSELVQVEEDYIEKEVEKTYKSILLEEKKKEIRLDLKKFNKLHLLLKQRLILKVVEKLFASKNNIEKKHIEDIIKLCENNIGNKYLTPNKNTKIYIKKGIIYCINIKR